MDHFMAAEPIKKPFFTPTIIVLIIIVINGFFWLAVRLLFGLGAATNLSNQFPWGIWIGIDVAAGVALAAGGFTTSALAHIFHKEHFHEIVRPALLTAMLGYTFVALGVAVDLGRYYKVWHPLIFWNGNSVLFEVGICVMTYLAVLYVEFIPVVTERFIGRIQMKGLLAVFNRPLDLVLRFLDRVLSKSMFFFIISGVVLSCLHQSSLGTLMMLAGTKIHPLWQSPISPLLFLISAISVGFPMVIMESIISSRSFGLKSEMDVLSKLARYIGPLLGVYLALKIGDLVIRQAFIHLSEFNMASVMWIIEVLFGIIIPLRMFLWDKVLKSKPLLFTASVLVIFGVLLNRINVFIVSYTPVYGVDRYWPSIGEISVTLAFIALEILLYRILVMIFPVISQPLKHLKAKTKFAVRGVIR